MAKSVDAELESGLYQLGKLLNLKKRIQRAFGVFAKILR
jgi:hypothetical protein